MGQYRVMLLVGSHLPIPGIRILQGAFGHARAGCGACLVEEAEALSNVESDLLRKMGEVQLMAGSAGNFTFLWKSSQN